MVVPQQISEDKSSSGDEVSEDQENWIKCAVLIRKDHSEKLEELLRRDPSLATRTFSSGSLTTLLHEACSHDSVNCVRTLLAHGSDISAKTVGDQETPFHVAARRDSIKCLLILLEKGVDINCQGAGPDIRRKVAISVIPFASPLDIASAAGSERAVELLLQRGAKINVNPPESSYSALHRAMEGRFNLSGYGNLRRLTDSSALASRGNRKVIELLLAHGCTLESEDYLGNEPFHIAVRRGAAESVEYLLAAHGKDINVESPGQFGYTPLQLSVQEHRDVGSENVVSVIRLLLKSGADRRRLGGPSIPRASAYAVAVELGCDETILKELRI